MKKLYYSLSMALLLLVAFATYACSKEHPEEETEPNLMLGQNYLQQPKKNAEETPDDTPKVYTLKIEASVGDDAGTRATLVDNGDSGIASSWTAGDEITVYKDDDVVGTLNTTTSAQSSSFIGTISYDNPAVDDQLRLEFNSPSYETQDGTLDGIASTCFYLKATVKVTAVTDSEITAEYAYFQSQQAIVQFTLKSTDGNSLLSASKLVVSVGNDSYTVTPTSPTSSLYVTIPAITEEKLTLEATVDDKIYSYTNTNVTFINNHSYTIGVRMKATMSREGYGSADELNEP